MKKNRQSLSNKFYLEGLNIEKFINHLLESGIKVFNLKKTDYNKVEFETHVKSSLKVEKLANAFNFKVVKNIKGFWAFFNFFKNRIGVVIGVILAVVLTIFVNQFTFNFKILGLENIEQNKVEKVLNDYGIKTFKINKFKNEDVEQLLSNKIPEISMVSVIKKGTTIIVNIKEKLQTLQDSFLPIVAEYNMLITSIDVYAGFTNLKVGDSILKGETIVYPYTFDSNNNPISCEPKAEITALTWFAATETFENNTTKLVRTGKYQVFESLYNIGKQEILKDKKDIKFQNYEIEESIDRISYLFLPIDVNKKIAFELTEIQVQRDFEKEKDTIINNLLEKAYLKVPSNILIEDEKVVLSDNNGKIIISVYLQASIIIGEKNENSL